MFVVEVCVCELYLGCCFENWRAKWKNVIKYVHFTVPFIFRVTRNISKRRKSAWK
jgi:hypothetical protein